MTKPSEWFKVDILCSCPDKRSHTHMGYTTKARLAEYIKRKINEDCIVTISKPSEAKHEDIRN